MDSNIDTAIQEELKTLEQLEGKDFYQEIIQAGLLCGTKEWIRVLKEIKQLNEDFHTLRTHAGAVADVVGVLHFHMYPADGAYADKPLCGRILIPKRYPVAPPVVQLLTKTNRYNVDIYACYAQKNMLKHMHSTMCFDVLRSKADGGIWEPTFTISCLMASLIQSIVSLKVVQEGGSEKDEVVSMELLAASQHNVQEAMNAFKAVMPKEKTIARIDACPVKSQYFDLPETFKSLKNDQFVNVTSQSIRVQHDDDALKSENVFSIGFDLSDLKTNPNTVFSIVLSSDPNDMQGRKRNTILVRNGVTATAAKKVAGGEMKWFYHGKPMNQNDLKLVVTVGYDQFCISYFEGEKVYVHGDCPVSFLTRSEIGNQKNTKFYLTVIMRNKGGSTVTVKTFKPDQGYLHPIYAGV